MPEPTSSEKLLLDLCKELLHLPDVGLDDDFFNIGGDSLLALQVYERVRRHHRQEIPLFDLSLPPTIRNLAQVIDHALKTHGAEQYRALKCIRPGDPDVIPLFLVHGGDGNARVFRRLTKLLDSRIPVYAFRWTGWDGRRGDKTLHAMATTYADELIRFHPTGPLRLGGYCIGGLIALEVAQILQSKGREIEGPVFIWDAPNVGSSSYHRREPWYSSDDYVQFRRMVSELEEHRCALKADCEPLVTPTQFSGTYEMLRRFPRIYTFARTTQIIVGTIPMKLRLFFNRPVQVKWRWIYCMTTSYFALKKRFTVRYPGSVTYFRSDVILGRPMNLQGWWSDPFLGFGDLCTGDFKGYVVGGNHVDVLSQPDGARVVNNYYFEGTE